MKLEELIDVIDHSREGIAWLEFHDSHNNELLCKANTQSSFLNPIYDRTINSIVLKEKNCIIVYLEGEI